MSVTVNKTWSTDKAKNLQKLLNHFGFKDEMGNPLAEDGIAGPKTQQALAKMNTYQQHLTKPDASTAAWQEQLNDWNYRDANGNQLKVDGVYGPKTDAATSEFENGFFDGFSEGKDPKKTVPTQTYPPMPKASDSQIILAVTPDYNTTGFEWQKSHTAAGNYGYALLPGETTFSQKQQPLKTGLTGLKAEAGGAIPTSTDSGSQPQTSQPYVYPDYLDYAKDAGVTSNFNGGGLMRDQMKKPDLSGIDFTRPLSIEDQNKVRQAIEIEKQQQAIDKLNMNGADPKYDQIKDYYTKLNAGTAQPIGDPEAGQKNPDGTWKIIARPGFTGSQSITSTLDEDEQTRLNSELMAKEYLKTHTVNDTVPSNDIEKIFKTTERDMNGNLSFKGNADDIGFFEGRLLNPNGSSPTDVLATYATEQEKQNYFALKQEFGDKAAKDYYDSLQQILNSRMGIDNASKILSMPDGPMKDIAIITQAATTGLFDYGTGWQQYFSNLAGNKKAVSDPYAIKEYDKIYPTLEGPMKYGSEFARAAGGALPDILLLLATKGIGLGADAAELPRMGSKGANILKLLLAAIKEPQIYGNAYNEAKESGFTDDQAQTYGVLYTSIDSIMGNLGNLKGGEDLTKSMTKRIMNDPGIVQDIIDKIKDTNKDVTKDYLKNLFLDHFKNNGTGTQNYTDEYIYQLILNTLKEKLSD